MCVLVRKTEWEFFIRFPTYLTKRTFLKCLHHLLKWNLFFCFCFFEDITFSLFFKIFIYSNIIFVYSVRIFSLMVATTCLSQVLEVRISNICIPSFRVQLCLTNIILIIFTSGKYLWVVDVNTKMQSSFYFYARFV